MNKSDLSSCSFQGRIILPLTYDQYINPIGRREERREKRSCFAIKAAIKKKQRSITLFVWGGNVGKKDMFNIHLDLNLNLELRKTETQKICNALFWEHCRPSGQDNSGAYSPSNTKMNECFIKCYNLKFSIFHCMCTCDKGYPSH